MKCSRLIPLGFACVMMTEAGCGPTQVTLPGPAAPIPVKYQDEAARGGLAVLSVARWEDYVAGLQPTFSLTADQALDRAIPTTLRQLAELQDALNVGVKLAPPTSSTASTGSQTSQTSLGSTDSTSQSTSAQNSTSGGQSTLQAGNQAASTSTSTSTSATGSQSTLGSSRQPGDLSKVNTPQVPALPGVTLPTASPLNGAADINPMTAYTAATALYQEVQLLNRYVRDAALRQNVRPYVVRLQVTVLPQLRGQAYDAYSTLSFLSSGTRQAVLTPYAVPSTAASAAITGDVGAHQLEVIPLLVTDSLEQSAAATSLSRLRGFGAALTALVQGFGASAEFDRQVQSLQAALGEDTNSLLTVSKIANNVLRVRFGATNQIGSGLALEARNHTVTLLLLVPVALANTNPELKVLSRLSVVRATDGKTLAERPLIQSKAEVHDAICQYIDQCVALAAPQVTLADTIAYAVQSNADADFNRALHDLQINASAGERVWADVLEILSRSAYATTSFAVPPSSPDATVEKPQEPAAIDDGSGTLVQLRGFQNGQAADLSAVLVVKRGATTTSLLSGPIDGSTGLLKLGFPSLSKLALCSSASPCTSLETHLFWTKPVDKWAPSGTSKDLGPFTTHLIQFDPGAPKTKAAAFSATASVHQIVRLANAKGEVRVTFALNDDHLDEKVFFSIDGADVTAVSPSAQVTPGLQGWEVTGLTKGHALTVLISFANLSDDQDVRLTPTNGQSAKEPLTFRVKSLPR